MRFLTQFLYKTYYCFFIIKIILLPSSSFAAGFQISEQSGTGLGRAFAGFGIVNDDLSNAFYNSAGLTQKEGMQIQVTGSAIDGSSRFTNEGSTQTIIPPDIRIPSSGANDDGGTLFIMASVTFLAGLKAFFDDKEKKLFANS